MKVVISAGGKGTRLLPATKELPKEMLPILIKEEGRLVLKPIMQHIFEELFEIGFREFCFIVGRGKRAIEDHFTSDYDLLNELQETNKEKIADIMEKLYRQIDNSLIITINQPKPIGFGDAIYRARVFTKGEPFILHAGDDIILSKNNDHINRLIHIHDKYSSDVTFFVEEINDPRQYGVIGGVEVEDGIYKVLNVVEKPTQPHSNLAIIAIYIFNPCIYEAIKLTQPDHNHEIQLADALNILLDQKKVLYAIKLRPDEKRIDIGTPESYLKMLKTTGSQ